MGNFQVPCMAHGGIQAVTPAGRQADDADTAWALPTWLVDQHVREMRCDELTYECQHLLSVQRLPRGKRADVGHPFDGDRCIQGRAQQRGRQAPCEVAAVRGGGSEAVRGR